MILEKAYNKVFKQFDNIEVIDKSTNILDANKKPIPYFMISQTKNDIWINWNSDVNNLIQYTEFETSVDFKHIAFNCKHENR